MHADDSLRIAIEDDLCVLRWTDTPDVATFEAITAVTHMATPQSPLTILSVADSSGKVVRLDNLHLAAAVRMSKALEPSTRAVAHVILMDGFVGSTVRMFVATLMHLRRLKHPSKVFGTRAEGQAWLAPFVSTPALASRMDVLFESLL